jgi:hypothetical protein
VPGVEGSVAAHLDEEDVGVEMVPGKELEEREVHQLVGTGHPVCFDER